MDNETFNIQNINYNIYIYIYIYIDFTAQPTTDNDDKQVSKQTNKESKLNYNPPPLQDTQGGIWGGGGAYI